MSNMAENENETAPEGESVEKKSEETSKEAESSETPADAE